MTNSSRGIRGLRSSWVEVVKKLDIIADNALKVYAKYSNLDAAPVLGVTRTVTTRR